MSSKTKREEYEQGKAHGRADMAAGIKRTPPDKPWVDGGGNALQADRPYWQGYMSVENELVLNEAMSRPYEDFFKEDLERDPIPGHSLQFLLDDLVDRGLIPATTNNRGHTWLAGKVGVSTSTVWRWCSGQRALRGPTAMAVRAVLQEMAPMKVHEITGLHMQAPEEGE